MKTIRLTVAQALLKFLDNQYVELDGVQHKFVHGIFGIFGHGNVTGLGEALEYGDTAIDYIQGHNEQGMVHAATAFAKQHRRLKIMACTSSIGPGAVNMVTGAATATTNRIPVLLLPGDIFACRQPDPVLQQLEDPNNYTVTVNDCFKPVSRYWDQIQRPEQLMTAMLNAFRVLTCPVNTGAVTISLPQDVQAEAYDYPEKFFTKRIHYIERPALSDRALQLACDKITKAKRPMIIAGGGVHYSFACQTLIQFAEKFEIPVAETQAGKGAINSSHPLAIGGIGVTGTEIANTLAKDTDLVLAIGTRLGDFTTASKSAFSHPDVEILQLNNNALDAYKMNAITLVADAKQGIEQLHGALENRNYRVSEDHQQSIKNLKTKWNQEIDRLYTSESSNGNSQTTVLGVLNSFLDSDDIIVGAAGSLPGDLHRLWQVEKDDSYHIEYAFSCMGYEVSGGLGVKMAQPDREVYVLVGDGSFLMLHSELLTSIQEGFKINIILFNNNGYQCIHGLQKSQGSKGFGNQFLKRDEQSHRLDGKPLQVDFAAYAKSLGAKTFYAKDIKDLQTALKNAKAESCSTLIEIKVAPDSMSSGYESWWRVGVAEVSPSKEVEQAHQKMSKKIIDTMPY